MLILGPQAEASLRDFLEGRRAQSDLWRRLLQ
jgi:hypothetical protein